MPFQDINIDFFIRLSIDFASVFVLGRLIYYPNYKNREFLFTFFIFNLTILLITFLLNRVEISIGAAFGLFAVFSMLRYRTEKVSTKDMTYLFLFISIGLISAIHEGAWVELILLDFIILGFTYLLESSLLFRKEFTKIIKYEKIEMILPEKHQELMEDLKKRTGLNIYKVSIHEIDFLKDRAIIKIYYYEK